MKALILAALLIATPALGMDEPAEINKRIESLRGKMKSTEMFLKYGFPHGTFNAKEFDVFTYYGSNYGALGKEADIQVCMLNFIVSNGVVQDIGWQGSGNHCYRMMNMAGGKFME